MTDLACDLPLRAFNAASVEIRRRIRRLNDSGVEPARGHHVGLAMSDMPQIPDESLHCREPSRRAHKPT
jgi:hypothetical protein